MTTNDSQLKELGYHVANIYLAHTHLFQFLEDNNHDGIKSFINSNLIDVQYRSQRVHKLLEELATTNKELHRAIVGSGVKDFIHYNLFLTSLLAIAHGPTSEETLEHMKYRQFIESLAQVGCVLPASSFEMFDAETQDWILKRLTQIKNMK